MKIGTPENPEIIDPDQPLRSAPNGLRARLARAFRILLMMIKFSAAAFFLDSVCIWLFDIGGLAWIPLLVLAFPALILTGLAVIADLFLFFALIATLSGRTVSVVQAPFARFVRYPGGPPFRGAGRGDDMGLAPEGPRTIRDVTPPNEPE